MKGLFGKSRRGLLIALVCLLAACMSTGAAFAAWPSFQNTDSNNGVVAAQPPISAPTVAAVDLYPNQPADVYTGVDTASAINDGVAYTLYNGGANGAQVRATNLASPSMDVWANGSVELIDPNAANPTDASADNVAQISTPYYDMANDVLYAAKTYTVNLIGAIDLSGWSAAGNVTITGGEATFSGAGKVSGNVTLTDSTNLMDVVSNLQGIDGSGLGTYEITLTSPTGTTTIATGGIGQNQGTFNQYKGAALAAGTYEMTVTVNGNTNPVTLSAIALNDYRWAMYAVNPSTGVPVRIISGKGEAATPVGYDNTYVYWGIWGGDQKYYQYPRAGGSVRASDVTDDFYGAGALGIDGGRVVYFGSDSGTVYSLSPATFLGIGSLKLSGIQADAGAIRSTMAYDGTNIYFTSQGTGTVGYLWKMGSASAPGTATPLALPGNSTSTPVVSANGYVYVGYYVSGVYPSAGGVSAVNASAFMLVPNPIYDGDPVQASPIVWTAAPWDYVYFTTNSEDGSGYCYRFNGTTAQSRWSAGGTSGNPYATQGFASDGGYLVYGDDGNTLYVMQ